MNLRKKKEELVFHHGPLFKGPVSRLGMFLVIAGLFMLAFGIIGADIVLIVSAALTVGGGWEIFRNVRGVVIQPGPDKVWSYTQVFGVRRGPHKKLTIFDRLIIARFNDQMRFRNYVHFELLLEDIDGKTSIFLEEFEDHREAERRAMELSKKLNLPVKDEHREKVRELQRRRMLVDPRSGRRRRRR